MTHRSYDTHKLNLDDAAIIITGGTGSFGQAFVDVILEKHRPRRLVIFSRDELKQSEMQARLERSVSPEAFKRLRFFIGDVRDRFRLELAMREIDIVVHAAALKQIPVAEYNPTECIDTNIGGVENVVWAALRNRVKKVIALSTDKACNPINLYGATKLASDKVMVAANNLSGDIMTRFSVVRYGNVVGSRGSVIPFFQNLAREGANVVPITDPRMTRFWITLDQGVNFVQTALAIMRGGEIFVPKIPSMRVADVARAILPDARHDIIGIRPGEKLHEMMIGADDARTTVDLGECYVIEPTFSEFGRVGFVEDGMARQVEDRFVYASDNNSEWLDEESLMRLIETG